ncbi:hypothetical protein C9374_003132 [Naegleria lovaniensis]|uniref:Uncharacterized protein n=1 Tax=Naegleria lovaniensis TaxID=51637 RepID=A0AA88GTH2_NAELO|nr:uncharacterized protein C9374_003132 [Naegleria lovaniensis]KAG2385983.1 hypothetical protein C9374_003132 [Naegleria lovaniensis]
MHAPHNQQPERPNEHNNDDDDADEELERLTDEYYDRMYKENVHKYLKEREEFMKAQKQQHTDVYENYEPSEKKTKEH